VKLVTAAQMRSIDRRAIEDFGVPGLLLMENAGRAVVEAMERFFGGLSGRRYAVVCGRGNNGGDGLVVARLLHAGELPVLCVLLARADALQGDAAVNLERARQAGVEIHAAADPAAFAPLKWRLSQCDVVVDAILGTGLAREVSGLAREAVEFLGNLDRPVVSVDIPSGLSADTGKVQGVALTAALTVTFGCPKVGHVLFPGAGLTGKLEVADIGLPPAAILAENVPGHLINAAAARSLLRPRPAEAHKGTFGHLLVVAGSVGKTGAAAMCAQAAARSGVGMVTAAVPEALNPILEVKLTEAMTEPLPGKPEAALERINSLLHRTQALAVGPGWATDDDSARVVCELVRKSPRPMVIDAGGLICLANDLSALSSAAAPRVVTPHPGEMAVLTGTSVPDVQADRVGCACRFAAEHLCTVVLKGARTVIAALGGRYWINSSGSVALASAGMGDVLTGLIGGLLAQGYGPLEAAQLATYWHGLAGELAARRIGEVGVLATDVIDSLPAAWRALSSSAPPAA